MTEQQTGSGAFTLNGQPIYLSFAPIRSVGWSLAVSIAGDEHTRDVNQLTWMIFGLILGSILIFTGLAYWLVSRLIYPIRQLTVSIKGIDWKDFKVDVPVYSNDEIGMLATAFNEMASQLRRVLADLKNEVETRKLAERELLKHRDQLEAVVRERTNELKAKNVQLEKLAITDPLTNLFNRRHFFNLAPVEFERARRHQNSLAVILLDIDHFKQVNDTYGHFTGDQVLISVARNCQNALRPYDILARFGGEEFIILLPESELQQALSTAERFRIIIAQTPIIVGDVLVSITASFGVAVMGADDDVDFDQLLIHADEALYDAKHAGRNQIVTWNNRP